jgi:hypothetical protein
MEIAQRIGVIWTPQDDVDLLCVGLDSEHDDADFWGMINANKAARDWLDGKISISDYCDILQINGISDPFEIIGNFCDHTELIMSAGL